MINGQKILIMGIGNEGVSAVNFLAPGNDVSVYDDKKEKDMRKDLRVPVEREVKVYLILDKIAEIEKLEVKEGGNVPSKVMEFLLKEAKWEEAYHNG